MGSSPPELPDEYGPSAFSSSPSVSELPSPPRRRREPLRRVVLALALFAATLVTTTLVGAVHYASFKLDFGDPAPDVNIWSLGALAQGLWYSASIIAILGCHELGHYFACRYYRVDASLPYFIPMPFVLTGTLGAVIRIRQPITRKRELFDIGIAGPIAGLLVAVPLLFMGLAMSRMVRIPADAELLWMGEPILLKVLAWIVWGPRPEGFDLNMHPMAFAGWFGLLATTLNLFPVGQLDGGHIAYAVLGRRSRVLSMFTVAGLVVLTVFVSMFWVLWTVLLVAMLVAFGPSHPRTWDEHIPLDRTRTWLAVVALIMFVLCFTPVPIEPLELISR